MGEWQPIETAPKRKRVILYYPPEVRERAYASLSAMYAVDYPNRGEHRKPTHWMPLPEPPKAGES
jgi:Protein of unknown function (DUF551)